VTNVPGPSQQPPMGYGPPPQGYGPLQPPPRKHRAGKIFLLGCGGLFALVIIVVVIAVAVASSSSGGSGSAAASSGSSSSGSSSSGSSGSSGAAPGIGAKARDGKFQFVVTSISHAKNVGDVADGFGDTASGRYTVLHVTVTNIGSQAQTLDDSSQYVYDHRGRQFSASSSADIDGNSSTGGGVFFNQINPGGTVHGKLYFDLPRGTTAIKAVLHDSAFSDGVTVSLRS
jgi:uncharacterized protein DUF4352